LKAYRRFAASVAAAGVALVGTLAVTKSAQAEISFAGKTVTMIVGSNAGGGTDATGRVIAVFLQKYLPGKPTVVVRNMPGAAGIPSLNFLVHKAAPDGLTVAMTSQSVIDPTIFRSSPNLQYDPKKLLAVGAVMRGGTAILIRSEAAARLLDKSKMPVLIGGVEAVPRPDMQAVVWAIEYLGWNAKWIVGYSSTNDTFLAADRGEIDVTATSNIFQLSDRVKAGSMKILTQSGTVKDGKAVGRPEFGDTPILLDQLEGRIKGALAQQAFAYWKALNSSDKILFLAPDTPSEILAAYHEAYRRMSEDPEFIEMGAKISDGFATIPGKEFQSILTTLVDTTPEALEYQKNIMRKQGLQVQ
jgi:tripartite-type tricarboxylate transporter receptor subunit TctC